MLHSMKSTRFLLPALLVGMLIPAALRAQQVSVRSMGLAAGEMPELFFKTEGEAKLTPVEWSTRQPSRAVIALHDGSLPLFRNETDEKGETKTVLSERVKLPADAKEIILFGWLDKDKLRLHAIPDNFLKAKHNDWLLINLSAKDIDFIVGKDSKPIRLASTQSRFYHIEVAENTGASVIGRAQIRGELKYFYSTYLPVKSGDRTIMLFSDDGDKIRTKPIYDKFNRREVEEQE